MRLWIQQEAKQKKTANTQTLVSCVFVALDCDTVDPYAVYGIRKTPKKNLFSSYTKATEKRFLAYKSITKNTVSCHSNRFSSFTIYSGISSPCSTLHVSYGSRIKWSNMEQRRELWELILFVDKEKKTKRPRSKEATQTIFRSFFSPP